MARKRWPQPRDWLAERERQLVCGHRSIERADEMRIPLTKRELEAQERAKDAMRAVQAAPSRFWTHIPKRNCNAPGWGPLQT